MTIGGNGRVMIRSDGIDEMLLFGGDDASKEFYLLRDGAVIVRQRIKNGLAGFCAPFGTGQVVFHAAYMPTNNEKSKSIVRASKISATAGDNREWRRGAREIGGGPHMAQGNAAMTPWGEV